MDYLFLVGMPYVKKVQRLPECYCIIIIPYIISQAIRFPLLDSGAGSTSHTPKKKKGYKWGGKKKSATTSSLSKYEKGRRGSRWDGLGQVRGQFPELAPDEKFEYGQGRTQTTTTTMFIM